jgi:hypothetical protein
MDDEIPFAYIQGLLLNKSNGLPYLEMCILCLPIIMLVLMFSDSYSFHMENYGRLLIIRNCNIDKRIINIYGKLSLRLGTMIVIQIIINALFNLSFVMDNLLFITLGSIVYFITLFLIVILEFCICSWIQDNLAQIFLNIYIFVSCIICYYHKTNIVKVFWLPGKIINLKNCFNNRVVNDCLMYEVIVPFILMIVIFAITSKHCKQKDIF